MTKTATGIKHVAMYLRISQEKKSENVETLANHRDILEEYCKENGLTYEVYGEVLSGGASEMEARPQLQKLLNEIEMFDAIIVMELSRLSRNGYISEVVLKQCQDYDKPIITPVHTYDLANNNNDVLTFRFGSIIASQEHALIGKRSKANKIQMSKAGLHISGNVPFGYRRNNKIKKLEIYEPEADIVRLIFKLHSDGLGSYKIRDILNEASYKSAKGLAFNLPSIKRIIRNEAYRGAVVFNDRKRVKEGGKYVYKTIQTYITENAHEPIIEPAAWYKSNKIREARAEEALKNRERSVTEVTMLKDLLYCGCCGKKLTIRKDSKSGKNYVKVCDALLPYSTKKCGNAGILLEYVIDDVKEKLEAHRIELEEQLDQILALDTSGIEHSLAETVAQLERQLVEQQKQSKKLIEIALLDIFTHEELAAKKQEITNNIESLQAGLEDARREQTEINLKGIEDKLRDVIETIEHFKDLDSIRQNEQLKTIIKQIRYYRQMPPEIRALSARIDERKYYPFRLEIEYI
ncbi:recombinase family protein [Mesobacillus harenae]|uniref:recombinase family protein n=1 Tax=Mesobacillus harenae TaxID=2213203 RepID=UPI00157FEF6B|nr:recombinase family protein [Mesobacillus harenae]